MEKREKPAYLRLYEKLREEIVSGSRPCGSCLPSRRQMAQDGGLSEMTVDHSYELLCEEGYTESRPRSGVYVIYRKEARTGLREPFRQSARNTENQKVTGPAVSEPFPRSRGAAAAEEGEEPAAGYQPVAAAFPFSVLARVMRSVLADYGPRILEKSPNAGVPELRSAISRYLERSRGIQAGAGQIVIGSGAEYLYGLVVEMLGQERTFGIEAPSYSKIEQVYRARGVRCDLLPLGRDGIRSDALRATDATVLHITPFRSYPSGVTASATKREEYLRWADEPGRFLVEDDFESEFSLLRKREETLFAHRSKGNILYLNSFSRTVAPSLRVGYMALPEEVLALFDERVGFYSCTVPAFEQYVLAELIDGGDFERHISRIRRQARKNKTESLR